MQLLLGTEKDFDEVAALLELSFPPYERGTRAGQRARLDDAAYRLWLVRGENGALLAFASVWELDGFDFLEHFAVQPSLRGAGLGAQVLQQLKARAAQRERSLILESEPPETQTAIRRLGFYERMGFVQCPFSYIQPSMQPGQPPVPLVMMSSPKALDKQMFAHCCAVLYERVYHAVQAQGE